MVLKLLLEMQNSSIRIFLDVDDLENIHDLKANVRSSRHFALLLTEGVFERRFVLEEVTTAISAGKNVILIWDKERCAFPDANNIPEHIRPVLLHKAIVWNPERDFRKVVINQVWINRRFCEANEIFCENFIGFTKSTVDPIPFKLIVWFNDVLLLRSAPKWV